MKKLLLTSALVAVAGLVACGSNPGPTDGGSGGGTGATGGGTATNDFSTSARILGYLESTTMVMTGTDIPTFPNGFNENIDYGASTQCYQKVSISTLAGNFAVTSDLGTLNKQPDAGVGSVGVCDRTTKAGTVNFTSVTLLVDNVSNNGECFDITATFNGFKQEGRGSISADGKTVTLELFFSATGHRCADGAVGAKTVKLAGGADFTGNALQIYRVQ